MNDFAKIKQWSMQYSRLYGLLMDATILHDTFKSAIDTIEVSASGDLAYVEVTPG